jgi:hypothetical protein
MTKIRQRTLMGTSAAPASSIYTGWGMPVTSSRITTASPIIFLDGAGNEAFSIVGVAEQDSKGANNFVAFDTSVGSFVSYDTVADDWPTGLSITVIGADASGNESTMVIDGDSVPTSKALITGTTYVSYKFDELETGDVISNCLTGTLCSDTGTSGVSVASNVLTDTTGISANIVDKEWAVRSETTVGNLPKNSVIITAHDGGANTITFEESAGYAYIGPFTGTTDYRVYRMPVFTYEWDGAAAGGGGGASSVISDEIIKRR